MQDFGAVEHKRMMVHRMAKAWKDDRSSYDAHFRQLGEYIFTRRTRFYEGDRNKGDRRSQHIINETGTLAARTLRAGMYSGITSPARPWRRLTTSDPDLANYGKVKDWLDLANDRLSVINRRSNFYNVAPTLFGDQGVFGTGAIGKFWDADDLYRFYAFPIGSYWLACNERGVVDTFMREFEMTVRQLIAKFGTLTPSGVPDWSKFSTHVKTLWDRQNYDVPIRVTMAIYPNREWDPSKIGVEFKRYASVYFETGSYHGAGQQLSSPPNQHFLSEGGFDLFPIYAPRWDITGEDVWGTSCPGMDALGSIKELQSLMKKKAKGLNKQLDPPLTGPTALATQKTSLISGDITYVDVREGMQGLRPIHETRFSHADVREDIRDLEHRIGRTFYVDMFMAITQMEGIQPRNVQELAMRHEERLLELGPVLERTNDEFLDPLTKGEMADLFTYGLLPPMPEEMTRAPLRVEYISMMAQAQKLIGIAGTERFLSYTGSVAAMFPDVKDKIDADAAIDDFADRMGVAESIVRNDEDVAKIRAGRQQAMEQQAQAERVGNAAAAAETLSKTDMSTDNALTRILAGA